MLGMMTYVYKKFLQVSCTWRRYTMPLIRSINTWKDIVEKSCSKFFPMEELISIANLHHTKQNNGEDPLESTSVIQPWTFMPNVTLGSNHLPHLPCSLGLLCRMWWLDPIICHICHSSLDCYAECDAWIQSFITSTVQPWIVMLNVMLESIYHTALDCYAQCDTWV